MFHSCYYATTDKIEQNLVLDLGYYNQNSEHVTLAFGPRNE